MNRLTSCCLPFVLILISGCGGPSKPEGFPPLHPAEIVVLQEGRPLEGATVMLYTDEPGGRWAVGGVSDAGGTVRPRTNGLHAGAPAGSYKVCVTKIISDSSLKDYRVVDPLYGDMSTTPLDVSIVPGKNKATVEVGPAVKIELEAL